MSHDPFRDRLNAKMKKKSHRPKSHSPKGSRAEHERARSLAIAREANSDATVQAFRSEILDGNLLQRDEVAGWVAQKAMDDRRKPTQDVRLVKSGAAVELAPDRHAGIRSKFPVLCRAEPH